MTGKLLSNTTARFAVTRQNRTNKKGTTMKAFDYQICVSPLTGKVYIAKVSRRNRNMMTDDRREVPNCEFVKAVVDWFDFHQEDNRLVLTESGKPIIEIKALDKEAD
jgi:hypothetical protein